MANELDNLRLGHCEITYNSVDLGHTKGGCELTLAQDTYEATVDQYGSTPVKVYDKGLRVEVKVTLSEYQLDILKAVLPSSTKVEGAGGTPVDALTFGKEAGDEIAGAALLLHPIDGNSTDEDVNIYKAVPIGEVKLPYKVDEETTYEVTFLGLIDDSKSDGNLIGKFGTASVA